VDQKKTSIHKAKESLNSLSRSASTNFIVVGKDVKISQLTDRALKKAGLQRTETA
jgi:hypothetical protein